MKNYTFKVKRDKKKELINIELGGQLNILSMPEIKKELTKSIQSFKHVKIQITQVEDTDITLMQLLKSFEVYCKKKEIVLAVEIDLNDDINTLFERAGLITLLN